MPPRPALARLEHRPAPDQWAEDELLTLAEAAALLFPAGPFDADALRIAVRRGELAAVEINTRTFTTLLAVRTMTSTRFTTDGAGGRVPVGSRPPDACDARIAAAIAKRRRR